MTNRQISTRLWQAKQHFSHPSHYFGDLVITGMPLFDQFLSSWLLTLVFAFVLYFGATSLSYLILYKVGHKKFTPLKKELLQQHKQQISVDIKWSVINILLQSPLVTLLKMSYPYYSKVQYNWNITYLFPLYCLLHIIYDQFFTYWAHRILHHPAIYHKLHYIHHKSKTVTPFSGFAFHPIDAFMQALPVFTSCFFIPLPIDFILVHGIITSLWAISIHDNVNMIPFKGILYAGSHSIHHFPWGQNYNYGKITSICDRLYGTYCDPQGITGYGYKPNQSIQNIVNQFNKIYENIIPDNGKQFIQKQSRKLAKQKWDKLLKKVHKQK